MQVENLNNDQLKTAQDLFDMMGDPVKYKTFTMEDMNFSKRLTAIEDKLSAIQTKLDHIFAGHVLVRGQWMDIEGKNRKSLRKAGFNHNR